VNRFNEIKDQLNVYLIQMGFKLSALTFVPCSGISGENLLARNEQSSNLDWYQGPTVAEAMGELQ
jgi:elongation factor 1 alpha-like protein